MGARQEWSTQISGQIDQESLPRAGVQTEEAKYASGQATNDI